MKRIYDPGDPASHAAVAGRMLAKTRRLELPDDSTALRVTRARVGSRCVSVYADDGLYLGMLGEVMGDWSAISQFVETGPVYQGADFAAGYRAVVAAAVAGVSLVWESVGTDESGDQNATSRWVWPGGTSAFWAIGPQGRGRFSLGLIQMKDGSETAEILLHSAESEEEAKKRAQAWEDGDVAPWVGPGKVNR